MEFKIPFASRSIEYTAKEIDIILNIAKKANPLTMGANLLDFESKFRDFANVDYAFAVNSATSALELVAQLCNFKNNDEIIIPSHTYTSSCYPFIKAGAKIKWADIDLDTRVISDDSIAQNLTKNTRAIIVPHLYGFFKDIKKLLEIAKQNNLIVIEDAAQAIGSRIDDLHSGSQGDFGIFSFHSHKNITTLGEGGMIVVKDAQISNEVPKLRHNGHCKFNFNRKNFWEPAMGNLDISEINGDIFLPNNYCISEIQCALGAELLERVDEINEIKRNRALNFIRELENFEVLKFHKVNSPQHNYHLLAAYFDKPNLRDKFFKIMAEEQKIQCAVQYYPLNRYDFYRKLGYGESKCKNADFFFDNMVSFPFHSKLSDLEIDYICESTKKTLKKIL